MPKFVADSVETTGLKWVAADPGGYTSIASGSLSGSSLSLSSIPTTYKDLIVVFRDYYFANDDHLSAYVLGTTGIYTNQAAFAGDAPMTTDYIRYQQSENTDNTDKNNFAIIRFYDYANTSSHKIMDSKVIQRNSGDTNYRLLLTTTAIRTTSAITSIIFGTNTGGNISGGTYILYGVK